MFGSMALGASFLLSVFVLPSLLYVWSRRLYNGATREGSTAEASRPT